MESNCGVDISVDGYNLYVDCELTNFQDEDAYAEEEEEWEETDPNAYAYGGARECDTEDPICAWGA